MIVAFAYAGIFSFISGSAFVLIGLIGPSPDRYGFCFAAIVVGYMVGNLLLRALQRRRLPGAHDPDRGLVQCLWWFPRPGALFRRHPERAFHRRAHGTSWSDRPGAAQRPGRGDRPLPKSAAWASALLGFFPYGFAAIVGIGVGYGSGTSALPMVAAVALVALGALLSYWLQVAGAGLAGGRPRQQQAGKLFVPAVLCSQ